MPNFRIASKTISRAKVYGRIVQLSDVDVKATTEGRGRRRGLQSSINCRCGDLAVILGNVYTQAGIPELLGRNQLCRPTVAFWIKVKLGAVAKPSPCGVPNFRGFHLGPRGDRETFRIAIAVSASDVRNPGIRGWRSREARSDPSLSLSESMIFFKKRYGGFVHLTVRINRVSTQLRLGC